mmetsp:Transcript_21588/g.43624  ORF Transcript_21588/g.43624 Transcript_21588/m.43624 type:complete len:758 (-) Transcript_21588:31-2304(-)
MLCRYILSLPFGYESGDGSGRSLRLGRQSSRSRSNSGAGRGARSRFLLLPIPLLRDILRSVPPLRQPALVAPAPNGLPEQALALRHHPPPVPVPQLLTGGQVRLLRRQLPFHLGEVLPQSVQVSPGPVVVLVHPVEDVECVPGRRVRHVAQGRVLLARDRRGGEKVTVQQHSGQVRHEFRVRDAGLVVVHFGRHFDHAAPAPFEHAKEGVGSVGVAGSDALVDEGSAVPGSLGGVGVGGRVYAPRGEGAARAAFGLVLAAGEGGTEHGVGADDVGVLGEGLEQDLLGVGAEGTDLHDELAAQQFGGEAVHDLLEVDVGHRQHDHIQVGQELLDVVHGMVLDAVALGLLRPILRIDASDPVPHARELPSQEPSEGSVPHDADVQLPALLLLLPGLDADLAGTSGSEVLERLGGVLHRSDESTLGGVGTQDAAKVGLLPEVSERVLGALVQLGRQEVEVEAVAESGLLGPIAPLASHRLTTEFQKAQEGGGGGTGLDLGEVDVAKGEAGEGLVERSGRVGEGEDYGGLGRDVFAEVLGDSVATQEEEAGEVGVVVLDALVEAVEAVGPPRQVGGDGGGVLGRAPVRQALVVPYHLGRSGGVVNGNGRDSQSPEVIVALRQRLGVRDGEFDLLPLDPRLGQKAVLHPELVLGHDGQVVPQHQVVVLVDGPSQGILDGEAAVVDLAGRDGAVAALEVGITDGDDVGTEEFAGGLVGVGSGFALIRDPDRRDPRRAQRRRRSGGRIVLRRRRHRRHRSGDSS